MRASWHAARRCLPVRSWSSDLPDPGKAVAPVLRALRRGGGRLRRGRRRRHGAAARRWSRQASRCAHPPTAWTCSPASRRSSQEPGRAAGGAGGRGGAREWDGVSASWSSAGSCLPTTWIAVTGSEGQDHDGGASGPSIARRDWRGRWPATWAPQLSRSRARSTPTATVVCEASSSSSRTLGFAPDGAVLLNLARTTSTATAASTLPRRQAAHLRQPGCGRAGGIARGASSTVAEATPVAFESPLAAAGEPHEAKDGGPRRPARLARRARRRRSRRPAARGAQSRERDGGGGAVMLARGVEPAAVRAALVGVRRRHPPWLEEVGRSRGRPLRRRLQGDQRGLRRWSGSARVPRRGPRDPRWPRQAGRTTRRS